VTSFLVQLNPVKWLVYRLIFLKAYSPGPSGLELGPQPYAIFNGRYLMGYMEPYKKCLCGTGAINSYRVHLIKASILAPDEKNHTAGRSVQMWIARFREKLITVRHRF
jgi:hypothetical protein